MDIGDIIKLINNIWPLLVAFGGVLFGMIKGKYALPSVVISALKRLDKVGISQAEIGEILQKAANYVDWTDQQRREFVAAELQIAAERNGIELSDSTANLIVEWVYKRLK